MAILRFPPEANLVVEAVLERVAAALEHYYAPQLHNTMHPADLITKLFELEGHEGLAEAALADA